MKLKPLAAAIALMGALPAHALLFELPNGIQASVDTTLSYGISVRASGRDAQLIGIANGGTSRSVNEDDGDLNFEKNKAFANVVKATMDTEVKWRNFGFFGRGTAFYDFDLHDSDKLGDTGKDRLGQNVVGLDGFFYGKFAPMGKNLNVRVGRQVISWGESTFIANGINVINPVDLTKLRIPGSELKEAYLPTAGIWASQEITKNATVEGFVLTNHDKVKLDPRGSYFSSNDYASDDAYRVAIGLGRRKDPYGPSTNPVPPVVPVLGPIVGQPPPNGLGPYDPAAPVWAPRSADVDPSDNGQWGLAFRYLATDLNNTEFGLYYMNYHSRVPFFSGVKGTPTSALTGTPFLTPICAQAALRSLCHTGTATYFASYPEDIHLWGVSFNTAGPMGIALQGEYSFRPNQPVQYATTELLLAALGAPNVITGFTQIPGAPAGATSAFLVPDGTTITGYERHKMSQLQTTATKSVPSVLGAEQLVLVGEVGFNWFHNLPSTVKFNGPATFLPFTPGGAAAASLGSLQTDGYLTEFSWGYRLAGRLEYANALFGGNLSPRYTWAHDVKGVGPNFNQGVKAQSFGISWEYQRKWLVDTQFTKYSGGRSYCGTDPLPVAAGSGQSQNFCSSANPLSDRDFYSVSISYSF